MAATNTRKATARALGQFRFLVAAAILRNISAKQSSSVDIPYTYHTAELCDDYALRILLGWLATRYGFPTYAQDTDQDKATDSSPLESWPCLAAEYPLVVGQCLELPEQAFCEARAYLDESLAPDLYLMGQLFEMLPEAPLTIDRLSLSNIEEMGLKRSKGQFYTPANIARLCLRQALEKYSGSLMKPVKGPVRHQAGASKGRRGTGVSERIKAQAPFKILDPACGTGNFLLAAADWLEETFPEDAIPHLVTGCLYGADTDGRALGIARLSLLIRLWESIRNFADRFGSRRANYLLTTLIERLRRNIALKDSLWQAQSTDDHNFAPASFDLVATNPPYLSFGSRNQRQMPEPLSRALRALYPDSSQYKIRVHSLFQEAALRYTKPGGYCVLLVPDAFLTGRYYQLLRRRILAEARIVSLWELPEGLFSGATVGRWCSALYKRAESRGAQPYEIELYSFTRADLDQKSRPEPTQKYTLPLTVFTAPDRCRFRLVFSKIDQEIVEHADQWAELGRLFAGHTGLRGRQGQKGLIADQRLGPCWHKGIRSGAQVRRHQVIWDGTWLNIEPDLLYAGGFNSSIINQDKLLIRQTADSLIAAVDTGRLYHLNNVHSFVVRKKAISRQIYLLSAVLNSKAMLYLYQLKTRETGRQLAQIDIETVESLPFPEPDPGLAARLTSLSRLLASTLARSQPGKSGVARRNLSTRADRAVDRLVYNLFQFQDRHVVHIENALTGKRFCPGILPQTDEAYSLARMHEEDEGQSDTTFPDMPD